MRRPALPIAILVRLHFSEVGVLAYGDRRVVHGVLFLAYGEGAGQCRKLTPFKVLLVANPLVCGEQEVKAGFLCRLQQRAIGKPVPTSFFSRNDGVVWKRTGKAPRRSVVKENEHRQARVPVQEAAF